MTTSFSDNHIHFTGSLPLKFIVLSIKKVAWNEQDNLMKDWNRYFVTTPINKIIQSENNKIKDLITEIRCCIRSVFSDNKRNNLNSFFKLYKIFQRICTEAYFGNSYELYRQGTIAILENNISKGIYKTEIIAGLKNNINESEERINAMTDAIDEVEEITCKKLESKIRFTYIRDPSTNLISNYSKDVLDWLRDKINCDAKFANIISGFDFSGKENPEDYNTVINIIKEIRSPINPFKRENIKISVHCGEDLFNNHLNSIYFINEVIHQNINTLCHGTILWIPDSYFYDFKDLLLVREKTLTLIASKGISFEICPTANLLLTPIKNYSDINTAIDCLRRKEISYSINSDNQTIFSTDVKFETSRVI